MVSVPLISFLAPVVSRIAGEMATAASSGAAGAKVVVHAEIDPLARTLHGTQHRANGGDDVRGNVPPVVSRADPALSRVGATDVEIASPARGRLAEQRLRWPL